MRLRMGLYLLVLSFVVSGCQSEHPTQTQKQPEPQMGESVIYGQDNRLDVFEVQNQAVVNLARSTVALMRSSSVTASGNGFKISGSNYGLAYNLCTTERFREQTSAAFCSGSLVGPNLILTAGHCVRSQRDCENTKFVFGFGLYQSGATPNFVPTNDVYDCAQLVHSEQDDNGPDFAVVRLSRNVVGRQPLAYRTEGALKKNDPLLVIGHPAGIPTKVAGGAAVRADSNSGYFVANLDTYGGNSGSAVFNANSGAIEGVLVRGEQDFVSQGNCNVSNKCSDTGCRGEDVTRVIKALPYLPAAGPTPTPSATPTPTPSPTPDPFTETFSSNPEVPIPDNNKNGVATQLDAMSRPNGRGVFVAVNIGHTWIGDLVVKVVAPTGQEVVLHSRTGASVDNIVNEYAVPQFSDVTDSGKWTLIVSDNDQFDTGVIHSWSVTFKKTQ
ncbi:MAG: proprotein convertase P-domain-containing protein [Oligoflexia bacterium]|nr:proprotein convertase P-domain-containing protein [Oligoflexia bacterium]